MLEFQHPLLLLLLLLLPPLAWWRQRRRPRLRFSSLDLLDARPSARRLLAPLTEFLLLLGLALAVVALARPQRSWKETVVRSEGIDIALVLDTSGSMGSPDYTIGGRRASRLDVARAVMRRFVEGRPYDRIALVVFGEEAFTQVPLTLDHDALVAFLEQVRIGMAGKDATALGDAIAVAARRMAEVDAPSKVLVLLTDGRNNAGHLEPVEAARAAHALGIRIYTIGVGGRGRRGLLGLPRGGELDEQTLRAVAEAADGQYFRADDSRALQAVYDRIDQMEKSTAEVKEYVQHEELYRGWLLGALGVLLLQALLSTGLLRRLP